MTMVKILIFNREETTIKDTPQEITGVEEEENINKSNDTITGVYEQG